GAHALLSHNGNTTRIRLRGLLPARLIALPVLAAGAWALSMAGMSVGQVMRGIATEGEMLPGQLIMLAIGLVCGIPALMALVGRSYVDIDRDLGRVTGVRQYGPIRIARTLPLASIRQVRTTVDDRDDVTVYNVELVGT